MCGIAGIIGEKANESSLGKMLLSQTHRGPDNTGVWISEGAAIGHNRLSIIDLTEGANQPMTDNSERYILSFNGEIYNFLEIKEELKGKFSFKTNSDTEVLLASYIIWGKECLSKLNGMFAFVIYDRHTKSLFGARDRFGVKPFYYSQTEDSFYFASEIKAIHAAGIAKIPNKQVWASYFAFGSYGMPNETFWQLIDQMPGGHYLELQNNEIKITKWYDFLHEIKKYQNTLSFDEVKQNYLELLKDSIKLRFRADVPVGFNVSGGLDSSALLTLVNLYHANGSSNINAFTFYTGDENYDELPWVEEMIKTTQNPLTKVLVSASGLEEKIQHLSYIQDEPFGGIPTIAYSELFKKANEMGVLVLLDGQGMDEQWAGYDYYLGQSNSVIQGVNKSPFKSNVLSQDFLKLAKKPEYPNHFNDDVLNKQYRDLFYTKIPRALRFNDRISMAYSTELREPFLDYRLVEFAFSQPLEYKIKNKTQKFLLREIVAEYLSPNISYAPKRPLQTPQREWLGDELKNYVSNQIKAILESPFSDWFHEKELELEWKKYLEGDNDSSFHIWQWISLSNNLMGIPQKDNYTNQSS